MRTHDTNSNPLSKPITLSKAEFALLLSTMVGEPFVLDRRARRDLKLSRNDLVQAEANLVARGLMGPEDGLPPRLGEMLAVTLAPGWKVIVRLQSRRLPWVQLALHLGTARLVGEGLRQDEGRLLVGFETVPQALEWLVEKTTSVSGATADDRPLEALLPHAETIASLLVVDTASDEPQTSVVWLEAEGHLWFLEDPTVERVIALTSKALRQRLIELLERILPSGILKEE